MTLNEEVMSIPLWSNTVAVALKPGVLVLQMIMRSVQETTLMKRDPFTQHPVKVWLG